MKIPSYEELAASNTAKILHILEEPQRQEEIKQRGLEFKNKQAAEIKVFEENRTDGINKAIELFENNGLDCVYQNDMFIVSRSGIRLGSFSSLEVAEFELQRIKNENKIRRKSLS